MRGRVGGRRAACRDRHPCGAGLLRHACEDSVRECQRQPFGPADDDLRQPRRGPQRHPRLGVPEGLPPRTRTAHPGLVHASGGTLAARVPEGSRGHRDARLLHDAGAGRRDHPPARTPPQGRRRDLLQRHRGAPEGHRHRPRHQARCRPRHRRADPHPRRPRPAARPHPRGRPVRHRGHRDPHRRAGRHSAHRLRRGPVHARQLPRRGRPLAQPRAHQGHDVRRSAALGRPRGPARGDHRSLPQGPDRGRRLRRPALRLLGRRAGPRRLPPRGPPRLGEGLRRRRPLRRPPHPLRRRHRRTAGPDGRGRRGRRRRRLARPARRGRPPRRPRQGAPGQPRPGGALRADPGRRGQDPRGAGRRRRSGGPHLQPGPRRHAEHGPGRAQPPRGYVHEQTAR
ncbi:hypothetical protein SBADM41S_12257 [Streptomyces badius]